MSLSKAGGNHRKLQWIKYSQMSLIIDHLLIDAVLNLAFF